HRPSPAGTHHQPSPDTHEPDRSGSVPCTCAARLPALHESRHGVARTSHSQGSPSHREPCPECPRNYAHCLEARRNPEPSCVVWLPIGVLYCSSCIPPSLYSDKKARRSKPHSRIDPEPMPHSRDEYLSRTPRASIAIKWSNCTRRHREFLVPVDFLNAHARVEHRV